MPTVQARRFCFTTFTVDTLPVFDESTMHYMIVGKETCPTSSRLHLQCYVEFKNKRTFNQARAALPEGAHLEVARGSQKQNIDYCKKDGDYNEFGRGSVPGARMDLALVKNRILAGESFEDLMVDDETCHIVARHLTYFRTLANNYISGRGLSALKDQLSGAALRPWQARLVALVEEEPSPRTVFWFWDSAGNTGKSFMARYLVAFHGAVIYSNGKVADIAHAYNNEPVVIFDLARTQEDKLDAVYLAMENFKNGRIFSPKYDSRFKVFAVPHVMVFANFAPDQSKLSADRWKIHELH